MARRGLWRAGWIAASVCAALATLAACDRGRRLVEVYDNGPVGAQPTSNGYYIWVGKDDLPPPGNSWKPVDYDALTPEQRSKIR